VSKLALDDRRQLHKDANKALDQNLAQGESVRVIIRGTFDSALIATDRRTFVFKKGFMAGSMFGKKVASYDFRNLTGVQVETGVMSGVFSLQGPGISSEDLSFWHQGKGDPSRAPHALALNRDHFDQAKQGAAVLRQLISDAQAPQGLPMAAAVAATVDIPAQIHQLAQLHQASILTDAEFSTKKAELLSRM
jgi:hypothetical protein